MKPLLRADPAVNEAVATASKRLAEALATLQTYMPSETGRGEAGRRESPVVRTVHAGAAILSLSVLADSAVEHYRGSFQNRAMFAPLVCATLTLATGITGALGVRAPRALLDAVYAAAAATGVAGLCFHAYNIAKRPGGFSWLNFFYSAPIGAPMAMALAGFFGRCALKLASGARTLFGLPAGRALAAAAAGGIAGTVGEAGLLHFRGAYHDPAMFLPVTLPPLSAGLLGAVAAAPTIVPHRAARSLLMITGALGVVGVGFHAFGVWRNMGGWRNWSQNVLNGPPLPAPPSFLGLAVIGLAALAIMEGNGE